MTNVRVSGFLLVAGSLSFIGDTRSPQAGQATIYYVSTTGNDTTGVPGNAQRPYRSPRTAYAAIPADITRGPGDHVILLLDSETYGPLRMSPRTTNGTHQIVIGAAQGTTPTLDAHATANGSGGRPTGSPALYIEAHNVVVQGLRFINTGLDTTIGRSLGGSEVMVRLDGSHVVIRDSYFDGRGRSPTITDMFLLICDSASNNVIAGNRFDYSGGKGLIYVGAGCTGVSPGKQSIRNNVLSRFGNNPQGICAAINFGGAGASLAGEQSVVENNTIYDNGGSCYGLLNTNGSALTVRNNIFSRITGRRYAIGCSGAGAQVGSSGVAHHSIMFGNTNNAEAKCSGVGGWSLSTFYDEDPQFVDPNASPPDLHLQSTTGSRRNGSAIWMKDAHCSVGIDKASIPNSFDLEPAPNGGRRNLGAYGNTPEASKSCRR